MKISRDELAAIEARAEQRGYERAINHAPPSVAERDTLQAHLAAATEQANRSAVEYAYLKTRYDAATERAEKAEADGRPCTLPCSRLQQEQFRSSSLESDVLALQRTVEAVALQRDEALGQVLEVTAERDAMKARLWELADGPDNLLGQVHARAKRAEDRREEWADKVAAGRHEIIALTAERDRLAAALRTEQAHSESIAAERGDALTRWEEEAAKCDELRADNAEVRCEIMALENSLNRVYEACGFTSGSVDRLVEIVKGMGRDAYLGRLVRAMPTDRRLDKECAQYKVEVYRGPRINKGWHDTPEGALEFAGIVANQSTTAPAPPNPDTDTATATGPSDTAMIDYLEALRLQSDKSRDIYSTLLNLIISCQADPATVREAITEAMQADQAGAERGAGA